MDKPQQQPLREILGDGATLAQVVAHLILEEGWPLSPMELVDEINSRHDGLPPRVRRISSGNLIDQVASLCLSWRAPRVAKMENAFVRRVKAQLSAAIKSKKLAPEDHR
jgi:hypothetical protein